MSLPDVIVVGGGIGGLGAAYSLARQGLAVRVLEQAPAFGEVGAGIQLAPNATRILDGYGLLDEAKNLGVVPDAMVMRDAVDGSELTRLDLRDLERRYGFPYLVIHRSDLHGLLVRACQRAGVDLATSQTAVAYDNTPAGALVTLHDGHTEEARVVIAADGLHSVARTLLSDDQPVSSAYVAYRGTVATTAPHTAGVDLSQVVVYVGPRCHFVHYGLRGGELLNQVAVFESPKALAGKEDWGTPDELDGAFAQTCDVVRDSLPSMWRDTWWRMFDRDPIPHFVTGNIALLGDAAHPPLQYIAQGAIMALEDGWVLGEHFKRARARATAAGIDWTGVLSAYESVRTQHTQRVTSSSRAWGELWHLDGLDRERRNVLLRARHTHDYSFIDWLYGPTALFVNDEPPMFETVPLSSVGTVSHDA
jgi:2-polyprenyl-6-methoxyphenol hydroxylase-like FAD-dependent oxidoreductase